MTSRDSVRGAALLLVMWLVALMASLIGAFALSARIERLQERVLTRGAIAGGAARAGLEWALVRVGDSDARRRWVPDGRLYHWQYEGIPVDVSVVDEQGKIDINAADQPLLSAFFRAIGVPADKAGAIAGAMIDWRDADPLTQPQGGAEDPEYAAAGLPYGAKDAPFETVAEIEQVLGHDAGDLHAGGTVPDRVHRQRHAGRVGGAGAGVDRDGAGWQGAGRRRAKRSRRRLQPPGSLGVAAERIVSAASRGSAKDARRPSRASCAMGGNGAPGSAYTALDWEEGTTAR